MALENLAQGLWDAVEREDLNLIQALLHHGADINCMRRRRQSLLHYAVEKKSSIEVIQTLLAHGADPNRLDESCTPMLVFPIMSREKKLALATLQVLLKHGARVDQEVGDTGQSLIQFAQDSALCPEVADLLSSFHEGI